MSTSSGNIDPDELTELTIEIVRELQEGFIATGSYWLAVAPVRANARRRHGYEGLVALKIAQWLLNTVSIGHQRDSRMFKAALDVLAASPTGEDPRAREVHSIIEDYAAGRLDETAFYKRTRKPFRRAAPAEEVVAPADGFISLADAERTLRASLSEGGEPAPDAAAAWAAFRSFALRPVHAPAPARIGHDVCLFQWGIYGTTASALFHWDCTRQWSIDDEHGSYDHMEQLQMTVVYEPQEELVSLQRGELWSGEELATWIQDVEKLDAFRIPLLRAAPSEIRILHEEV